MTRNSNIKKNYIYNLLFQIFNIAIPLISTPYVSRVLGADGVGTYSYTLNIISYLILVGDFGLGLYATRQVAYCIDNPDKLKKCFSNLLFTRLLTFIPVLVIYTVIVKYSTEYRLFYLIELIFVLGAIVDVSWYYNGQENFRITIARGSIVKLAGLILIFCLVKSSDDVYYYVLILGLSQFIGNVLLFAIALKEQGITLPEIDGIKENIKGGIILFIPQIASSLYFYCDKIMIKFLSSGIAENGYYEQSQKLIRLSTTVITALPTVMMPRIAAEFSRKNSDEISEYMKKSLGFVIVMGFPMTFGLIGISDLLVPWFFGEDFDKVRLLLKIMSPIIFFNSIYNVIGYQYFIAVKKEKVFTYTILCGAAANIVLNFLSIPIYGSAGAALASTFAEITIVVAQSLIIFHSMKLSGLSMTAIKSLIGSAIMLVLIYISKSIYRNDIAATFGSIMLGGGSYAVLMFILRNTQFTDLVNKMIHRRNMGSK